MTKPMIFILQPDDETEKTKKAETFIELFDKDGNLIETATILVNSKQFN